MASTNLLDRITLNPDILFSKSSFVNMRYTVLLILGLRASEMKNKEILKDYTELEEEVIHACPQFAAVLSEVKSIAKVKAT
jgi:uncharacterized protein (DUF433 family)